MEQSFQALMIHQANHRKYKTLVLHVTDARASFKVAHELIPFFIEFKGIDVFFRNKIEASYQSAIGYLEHAYTLSTEIRYQYKRDPLRQKVDTRLSVLQNSIRELIADTAILVSTFYDKLGTPEQLNEISSIKARFNETTTYCIDLVTEVK